MSKRIGQYSQTVSRNSWFVIRAIDLREGGTRCPREGHVSV